MSLNDDSGRGGSVPTAVVSENIQPVETPDHKKKSPDNLNIKGVPGRPAFRT